MTVTWRSKKLGGWLSLDKQKLTLVLHHCVFATFLDHEEGRRCDCNLPKHRCGFDTMWQWIVTQRTHYSFPRILIAFDLASYLSFTKTVCRSGRLLVTYSYRVPRFHGDHQFNINSNFTNKSAPFFEVTKPDILIQPEM